MSDKLSSLCTEFTSRLASPAPVPGGGGAAAMCAALSSALVSMAGELSLGKKSTAAHSEELISLIAAAKEKLSLLLELIDADAAAFEPLSRAYSIPKDNPDRDLRLSQASITAASAPMDILSRCLELTVLLESMAKLCSRLMLSDVACAASLCRAAAECAAVNVYVNLPGIADAAMAAQLRERADSLLSECTRRCNEVFTALMSTLN